MSDLFKLSHPVQVFDKCEWLDGVSTVLKPFDGALDRLVTHSSFFDIKTSGAIFISSGIAVTRDSASACCHTCKCAHPVTMSELAYIYKGTSSNSPVPAVPVSVRAHPTETRTENKLVTRIAPEVPPFSDDDLPVPKKARKAGNDASRNEVRKSDGATASKATPALKKTGTNTKKTATDDADVDPW